MYLNNKYSCCFFGHKDTPKEIIPILKNEIENLIINKNVSVFYLGGYGNFDIFAANILKKLKKYYPFVTLIYVTAYISTLEKKTKTTFQNLMKHSTLMVLN